MKSIHGLVPLLATAVFAAHALGDPTPPAAADTGAPPAYLVRYADEPIRPDGHLDEKAWESVPWSSDFVWIDAGDPAPLQARFKAVYNSNGLYFACEYELDEPAPPVLDPNFPYACEIMLDPDGTNRNRVEYAASPDGSQWSIIWHGALAVSRWTSTLNIATQVGISRITSPSGQKNIIYEVAFPWGSLKDLDSHTSLPPQKGYTWRANFSRVQQGKKSGDFTWATMGGMYYIHNPGHYGWLVFSGKDDPLTDLSTVDLKPLPDVYPPIADSKHFQLFNQTMWGLWLWPWSQSATDAAESSSQSRPIFVAGNTFATLLNADGTARWKITRKTADLPQFIRATALVGDKIYATGDGKNGMGEGMVTIDADGRVHRLTKSDGYDFHPGARIIPLAKDEALIRWQSGEQIQNQFQFIAAGGLRPPVQASGKVLCAASLGGGRIAVGTSEGFSCYDSNGNLVKETPIAGGITSASRVGDVVIGVSGLAGIYRMTTDGHCTYYPFPLRKKFDAIYPDGKGNCWASYTGGVAFITHDNIQYFYSPLGMAGLKIKDAVHTPDGRMVFAAEIPSADWYESTDNSAFLLVTDGEHWQRYGQKEGVPGQFTQFDSLQVINGHILFNTYLGIFNFIP